MQRWTSMSPAKNCRQKPMANAPVLSTGFSKGALLTAHGEIVTGQR
jgi:hypothetical protein